MVTLTLSDFYPPRLCVTMLENIKGKTGKCASLMQLAQTVAPSKKPTRVKGAENGASLGVQ